MGEGFWNFRLRRFKYVLVTEMEREVDEVGCMCVLVFAEEINP